MAIFLWSVLFTLFIMTSAMVVYFLISNSSFQRVLRAFVNGFRAGLKESGLKPKTQLRYPVDLWVWDATEEPDPCEECLDKSDWPPMDIADWLKEDLPRNGDGETACGRDCQCRLARYQPKKSGQDRPTY